MPTCRGWQGQAGNGEQMRKGTAESTVHCLRPLWAPQYVDMGPLTCQEQLEPKKHGRTMGPGLDLRYEETEPQEGSGFKPGPASGSRPHLTYVNDTHVPESTQLW